MGGRGKPSINRSDEGYRLVFKPFFCRIFARLTSPPPPANIPAPGSLRMLHPKDTVVSGFDHTMFMLALSNPNNSSAKS